MIRPFCIEFLETMSKYYEIIIFTAAMQDYANWVIDNIDPSNEMIKHRFFRQHTINNENVHIKDLSRIGRDLSKMIIIDNVADNF
jgi:CTD small phosphatase-like protein 2